MASIGLFNHVGNIHRRMMQVNTRDLSSQFVNEMESDHPNYSNYYKEYGKAIKIVRTVYQIPIDGITGLEPDEVEDIEAGRLYPRATNLCCYSETIGITLDDFLKKVATNVDVLKALEAIA